MNMAHLGQIGKFVHILRKSHWFADDEFAIMENVVNDREAIVNKIAEIREILYTDCALMLGIKDAFSDVLLSSQQYLLDDEGVLTVENGNQAMLGDFPITLFSENIRGINCVMFHDGDTVFKFADVQFNFP